jgi:hypothetical protein
MISVKATKLDTLVVVEFFSISVPSTKIDFGDASC